MIEASSKETFQGSAQIPSSKYWKQDATILKIIDIFRYDKYVSDTLHIINISLDSTFYCQH